MNARTVYASILLALALAVTPTPLRAEVIRVEITQRTDVLGGKAFGQVGPYEKVVGKIFFAIDPKNPRNKGIVDLDKAPRNGKGQVEFSSDLLVFQPKDPSRGNGALFFDAVNRGNMLTLTRFNSAMGSPDPTTEAQFGNGFLMPEG